MDVSVSGEEKEVKEVEDEEEETKTVSFQFPFILLKTRRGVSVMDKLAALRPTERLGWVALYLFPLVGAVGFALILFSFVRDV